MRGTLRWGSELEPSLLTLIRVIGYTKMMFFFVFLYERTFFFSKSKHLQVLDNRLRFLDINKSDYVALN